MGYGHSLDLRKRIVEAVQSGSSARAAARRFGVSASSAIILVGRWRATGSYAPGQVGGQKRRRLAGHSDYEGAPSDGSTWTSGGVCQVRILRGGSYDDTPVLVRSANRDGNITSDRYNLFSGIRVARTLSRR